MVIKKEENRLISQNHSQNHGLQRKVILQQDKLFPLDKTENIFQNNLPGKKLKKKE
jgi:hypothetical protein